MLLCRVRGAVLQQLQEHDHSISVSRSLQRKVVRLDERQEVPAILRGGWGHLMLPGKAREVCDEGQYVNLSKLQHVLTCGLFFSPCFNHSEKV